MTRSSTNSDKHPYMRPEFWVKNPFWNNDRYTQKSKDYYNSWVADMVERNSRYLVNYFEK